jgi:2-polyprenyl-3-methyl-5-hydroxy-6-metoxy-1,4-benzoquinol methylase
VISRILEPEVMETEEEASAYDSMDHREVNAKFVDEFLLAFPEAAGAEEDDPGWLDSDDRVSILDLGTGTAQIPVELCRRTGRVRIMAADAAIAMLEIARLNVEFASVQQQVQLDHVDAKDLHYRDGMFDAVMSNSIVHHIPQPAVVLREAVRVTRAGGLLFFRDLLRPNDTKTLDKIVETYAGEADEAQQRLFRASLHAALTLDEIRRVVGDLGFSPDSVQQTSDRHWTWNARKA